MIPLWGIMGAAFATLGAFVIMFFAIFFATNRLQHTSYNFYGWIFPIVMWLSIILLNNGVWSVCVVILYPICWYNIVLNVFEKEKIREFFV